MTTDYDSDGFAAQYKEAKQQPWRSRIETYSFLKLIGDVRGRRVLDVACGEGHFTRLLADAGAERVVGIDLSERMVELARRQEAEEPHGIEFRVEDALAPAQEGQQFDLAVAAWLLVYARDRTELSKMCEGLAGRLESGGRFVTVMNNPDMVTFDPPPDHAKYGFDVTVDNDATEGAPIVWTVHLSDGSIEILNYFHPLEAYEAAFTSAGFTDFRAHPMELAPLPDGHDDHEFWAAFLSQPPAIMVDCVKT